MTLRTVVTSTLLAFAALVVVFAFDLVLLLFAAVLIAVVLDGTATRMSRLTGLARGWCIPIVLVTIFGSISLVFVLAMPTLIGELAQLRERLPEAVARLQELVNRFGWLESIVNALPQGEVALSRPGIAGRVSTALTSTVGAMINILIVLLVGLYLAFDPCPYVNGAIRLFPKKHRERAREVLASLRDVLFHWMQGQVVGMTVVGVLVAGGLWALGIPLAGTLGLIAGLFEFVPNIGPILSGVPAALLALTVSPTHVIYVIALYVVVQTLESYLLMPLVMRRAVSLPPALTIVAQLIGTLTAGWLGLLLATPLVATLVVLVQKVYLESVLGEEDAAEA
jgi:predicted PurR-regulated permease PerM